MDPQAVIDLNQQENKEFLLSFGKRKFKRVNLKWEEIHELKVYLIYRKVKEGKAEKNRLCEKLSHDMDFKRANISLNSIKMKFDNYKYLDTGGGLSNFSKKSEEIFDKYKDFSVSDLENEIAKN